MRKAQRRAVVRALQAIVNENTQIREEMTFFSLMAAPGYPELADEMLALNVDRKETAFIIIDTPFRLQPQAQKLLDWMSGNNAVVNGEDGLITHSNEAASYYPSAITSDLSGNDVVVPPSHVVLRTMAYNDQVAYPWFAPAGLTRGVVTNATNVGYLNGEGEFVPVALTNGQRDTLYGDGSRAGINPIARFPGQGLYVWGQRTLQPFASALDRINVARLVAYLRERFDPLARPFIFEPNDTITRANAKQVFTSFLADLMTKRALYDFIVVCDETNNTPARIDRNELWIDIAIEPVKAAEFIYIPIRVVNTGELSMTK
jgi:phage tail sheath protein FI